jgi:hypothetical protein
MAIFICDRCVLPCVDIIEENFEDRGRAAFRHCLRHADEPRYCDLKRHSQEQRKLLEAAEPIIPVQYTALRESIAILPRPQPETSSPSTNKRKARREGKGPAKVSD